MVDLPDALLLEHYDRCLAEYGDTAKGANWPDEAGRRARFEVMLDLLEDAPAGRIVLCDLGCGTGELLAHLRERGLGGRVDYIGVDRSERALAYAHAKFPDARFLHLDVNDEAVDLSAIDCDYLVANGLFTVRAAMSREQMWDFLQRTVRRVWPHVRRGLAFNVMSTAVERESEELFHAPMDDVAALLHELAGRRVRLRADYGQSEYTAYANRARPTPPPGAPEAARVWLPAMRPRLATADRLLPYLQRIDERRIYSNFGPLALEFEDRLRAQFALPPATVVSASSGLAALVGAILGVAGRAAAARPLALVPSYTFVATASAVELCGYQATLADVDAHTWQLDPAAALAHPELERIGLVVPVAPYGRPVPQAAWLEFQQRTGIPVVIDGAACFDTLLRGGDGLGPLPVALSFHATKSLGTGEGGAVVCTDTEALTRAGRALNFGFHSMRDCRSPNTNGKLSEYHAAVGLAELDGWDAKLAAFARVAADYRSGLHEAGLDRFLVASPDIAANYVLFAAADIRHAQRACERLEADSIEFRFWYGLGLHRQTYHATAPAQPLPVTEALAPRVLGLPTAPDLDPATIARVCAALRAAGA